MDWSEESDYLMTSSGDNELLYWEMATLKQSLHAHTELRDSKWQTWTSPLGWSVRGVWGKSDEPSEIKTVRRSPDGSLLALGDELGNLKFYPFPCTRPEMTGTLQPAAHASMITNLCFLKPDGGDLLLFSTSSEDQMMCQWHLHNMPERVEEEEDHMAMLREEDSVAVTGWDA